MLMVVIGLVALLPILATLQYRWIGQLSEGEVDRLRTNLQSSAYLFGRAVNQEITRAPFAFRVSFTGSLDQISRELSLNYQYWSSRVSRPDLIENIYWIDYDENQDLRLFRFEPAHGALEEEAWPADLIEWKDFLIERNKRQIVQYTQEDADSSGKEAFIKKSLELMANRPAIPIPVSIDDELASSELFANLNATSSGRSGYTLVTLNQTYLSEKFFPELTKEFFNTGEDLDLMIVTNSDAEKVIYKSSPALTPEMFEQADAEAKIGHVHLNRFASASRLAFAYASLVDRDQILADSLLVQMKRSWQPALQDSFIQDAPNLMTDFPMQAIIQLAQEDDYQGELTAEDLLVALTSLTQERNVQERPPAVSASSTSPLTVQNSSPEQVWTLKIRHKTGSLDASVAANRRRNLAMSFGILLVLGVATVLIYSSSRRAHQLAEQQMSFVTGVSHELRTPLSVIKSAADNLADGVVSDPGRMQNYGKLIQKESNRLTDMVEQILELAGIMSSPRKPVQETASIHELIDNALESCQESLTERSFEVEKDLNYDLPELKGDVKAFRIAISNLITNAIKYSNGSSWIGIKAEVQKNGRGPELRLSVSDKGIGIPQEDLPYIFEDFYRGPAVRNAQIKGNGIGLSIVKKTMEAHSGRVSVHNNEPAGTTFTLHFPVK